MKTLILFGSPRKNGETAALLQQLHLQGEAVRWDLFGAKIAPCSDCRYCRTHAGCCVQDDMQKLYKDIETSDRILLASPVWFGTLPGPVLSAMSRLQAYFSAAYFRKEPVSFKSKKGAVLLTGGGSGGGECAYDTAVLLLKQMGVVGEIPRAISLKTDQIPVRDDTAVSQRLKEVTAYLNR